MHQLLKLLFAMYRAADDVCIQSSQPSQYFDYTNCLRDLVKLPEERAELMQEEIDAFVAGCEEEF